MVFPVTRIYSDSNGDSHFGEVTVPLQDGGTIGRLSEALPAKEVIFREVEPTYDYDFHTAPQRQYIILLDGAIEIETSLGEKRIFRAGEVLLVEDTTGKGHKTRNLEPVKRRSVFITLP
jgi:quercetin dioxygenase-like cupin family protein